MKWSSPLRFHSSGFLLDSKLVQIGDFLVFDYVCKVEGKIS